MYGGFIISKNNFPVLICPPDIDIDFARKIVEHLQEKCGPQLGLASSVHYHVQEIAVVPQELIEQLKLENENGN